MTGAEEPELTAAVVVPTYKRAECLERCLRALVSQTRVPDRIVVVARETDTPTFNELERLRACGLGFEVTGVRQPGQAAAIMAGVASCKEQVVAVVDDDTAASGEWLDRLLSHYRDDVGGVGGRDVLGGSHAQGTATIVGKVAWYGRVIGNHHLGAGPPRDVDVLKAANASLRRELWVCDPAVRGRGAQVHYEMDLCLRARRRGWRLVYDPAAVVDHFPGTRYDGGGRGEDTLEFLRNVSFNGAYAMTKNLRWRTLSLAVPYMFVVGNRAEPGLVLLIEAALRQPRAVRGQFRAFRAATQARVAGIAAGLRQRNQW